MKGFYSALEIPSLSANLAVSPHHSLFGSIRCSPHGLAFVEDSTIEDGSLRCDSSMAKASTCYCTTATAIAIGSSIREIH